MKKSFKLFHDSLDVLDELSNEQAGELFKAIRAYEIDNKETLVGLMKAIFTPFKNNSDRAKEEYTRVVEANKANGLKGGRPKRNKPNGLSPNPNNPDKDKDKDKDKDIPKGIDLQVWEDFEQHRREISKPLTKLSRSKNLNVLLNNLNNQREIVDSTIQNRWTGLFPIKTQKKKEVMFG